MNRRAFTQGVIRDNSALTIRRKQGRWFAPSWTWFYRLQFTTGETITGRLNLRPY